MGANRLEKYETVVINRRDLNQADYNPRKISETAAKKLRKFLRDHGLWSPLVVNKQTMTLVSGHQRLSAMDAILRKDDYDLTVSMVDVDEATEIKGNVFLNNPSAQGEWDVFKLESLRDIVPDLDYIGDLGFDESDVSVMLGDDFLSPMTDPFEQAEQNAESNIQAATDASQPNQPQQGEAGADQLTAEGAREIKARMREQAREQTGSDGSYHAESADYTVTIVFPNNREKREFMKKIRKPEKEKHIKHTVLHDIASGALDILL